MFQNPIYKKTLIHIMATGAVVSMLIPIPAIALEGVFSLSFGADYSTGDYGATQDTDVWSIPVSFKYTDDRWSLRLSTSYLRVTGPNFVTPEGDFFSNTSSSSRATDEGMGDVNITGTYTLLDDLEQPVGLDLSARIKIPTADEDKFLGTGETDYALSAEVYKTVQKWTPYFNIGYRWRGDQPNRNLKNVWSSSIGSEYSINNTISIGGSYDWGQRTSKFVDHMQEASVFMSYKLDPDNRINFYLIKGFSDASPDWGSGMMYTHYF